VLGESVEKLDRFGLGTASLQDALQGILPSWVKRTWPGAPPAAS